MAQAQASEVTYELHSLGWKSFQHLCATIISEIFGQPIQEFFDSYDGGRDGAFRGVWESFDDRGKFLSGSFTVQCKFTADPQKIIRLSDLTEEIKKARRLAQKGLCDNYIICTNAKLTGDNCEIIEDEFRAIPEIKECIVYGKEVLSQIIKQNAKLRMLIPRIYGLGDLGLILDERAYAQANEVLSSLGDDLQKFVITESYKKSAKAIEEEGFVLLLGEPACGKSTIAATLAIGALDRWGCYSLKCTSPSDFQNHYNPHEKQFFWIDDAFGATQLSQNIAIEWNAVFPMINSAIKRGSKFVFTSRDYVYRLAKQYLKETALPLIKESQVVIEVKKLIHDEKEKILYNHIKLGNQPLEYKKGIKPYLEEICISKSFTPEIARRLGNKEYTKQLSLNKYDLEDFIEHPMGFLKDVLQNLDKNIFSALALVFMHNGQLASPIELNKNDVNAIMRLGGVPEKTSSVFFELKETFLKFELRENNRVWIFKHPTLRDAMASLVAENPELLDIYLSGTPLDTIFNEVSCGNVGQEGVKVIIPESRFEQLIARIDSGSLAFLHSSFNSFLAHRCNEAFLYKFTQKNPIFIENLKLGSRYNIGSIYNLINKLTEFNLLPKYKKDEFLAILTNWAIEIPDVTFLDNSLVTFITIEEKQTIFKKVKEEVFSKLLNIISEYAIDFDEDEDDVDYYFDNLKECLNAYCNEVDNDVFSMKLISAAKEKIKEEESSLPRKEENYDEAEEESYTSDVDSERKQDRSIFDDVDG